MYDRHADMRITHFNKFGMVGRCGSYVGMFTHDEDRVTCPRCRDVAGSTTNAPAARSR